MVRVGESRYIGGCVDCFANAKRMTGAPAKRKATAPTG